MISLEDFRYSKAWSVMCAMLVGVKILAHQARPTRSNNRLKPFVQGRAEFNWPRNSNRVACENRDMKRLTR